MIDDAEKQRLLLQRDRDFPIDANMDRRQTILDVEHSSGDRKIIADDRRKGEFTKGDAIKQVIEPPSHCRHWYSNPVTYDDS